jgi:hypothetical protein
MATSADLAALAPSRHGEWATTDKEISKVRELLLIPLLTMWLLSETERVASDARPRSPGIVAFVGLATRCSFAALPDFFVRVP